MYRRGYCLSTVQRHHSAAATYSEKYRKHVDPTYSDQDGRNAVHLSVLLAVHDSVVDNSTMAEAALDQVCLFVVYFLYMYFHFKLQGFSGV